MKTPMTLPKPRNPLIVPALRRRAGRHRTCAAALRQGGARALKRELETLKPPIP